MNTADILKAKRLSAQVAAFGGKKVVVKPKLKPHPTPFKFEYKALQTKNGENGKDGRTPTSEELVALVKPLIKEAMAGMETEAPEFEITDEMVKQIVQKMHTLPEVDKLEVSKGIRNASSFIFGGTKYQTSELMHGGSAGVGGSTLTSELPTGTVNDINVTFTVAHTPLYIVVNGAQYTVGTGIYSSFVGGTITLSSPVGQGGFVMSYYNA